MTSARPALSARRQIPGPPRDVTKERLLRLYRRLTRRFGPQHWWPGRTPFEIAAGAILTQHTAWTNAARALRALDRRGLLSVRGVESLDDRALAKLLRPAGTYRIKARRLRSFTRWLRRRFDGRFGALRRAPLVPLRQELLGVAGLGPETVDAILLYAAGRPVFVADAYTRRVLERHGLMLPLATYEEARAFLEAHLPSDPALFNEFHALLVELGKRHCRTSPECGDCPLRFDLPPDGLMRAPAARGRATPPGTRETVRKPRAVTRRHPPRPRPR